MSLDDDDIPIVSFMNVKKRKQRKIRCINSCLVFGSLSMFICSYVLMAILVMHECLYVFYIKKNICWVWGIESDVRGGRGHMSFHLHVVGPAQYRITYSRNKEKLIKVCDNLIFSRVFYITKCMFIFLYIIYSYKEFVFYDSFRSWGWKCISWTTLINLYGLMDLVKGQREGKGFDVFFKVGFILVKVHNPHERIELHFW